MAMMMRNLLARLRKSNPLRRIAATGGRIVYYCICFKSYVLMVTLMSLVNHGHHHHQHHHHYHRRQKEQKQKRGEEDVAKEVCGEDCDGSLSTSHITQQKPKSKEIDLSLPSSLTASATTSNNQEQPQEKLRNIKPTKMYNTFEFVYLPGYGPIFF